MRKQRPFFAYDHHTNQRHANGGLALPHPCYSPHHITAPHQSKRVIGHPGAFFFVQSSQVNEILLHLAFYLPVGRVAMMATKKGTAATPESPANQPTADNRPKYQPGEQIYSYAKKYGGLQKPRAKGGSK